MPASPALPRHLRPRRERIFGEPNWTPLDRNAKARIMAYARGWTAKHKRPGQHRGPLTRAMLEVLEALLWGFHNAKSGRCFPSYESIAAKAECNRDTVYEAIKVLERADILTWVNRIVRTRVQQLDLFGKLIWMPKIIQTSNAYTFRDPLPCHVDRHGSSKSENPTETQNQDFISNGPKVIHREQPLSDDLQAALASYARSAAAKLDREAALSAS